MVDEDETAFVIQDKMRGGSGANELPEVDTFGVQQLDHTYDVDDVDAIQVENDFIERPKRPDNIEPALYQD